MIYTVIYSDYFVIENHWCSNIVRITISQQCQSDYRNKLANSERLDRRILIIDIIKNN